MNRYAIVDDTGRITQLYSTNSYFVPCDDDVSDTTHYADSEHVIHAKRPLEFELTTEGLTVMLSGLPTGVNVETNGLDTVTDEDPLEITYDVPGAYEIKLSGHVEYLDTSLEVTVDDA
ncbi:hypothetical protein [Vreelandella boliviensis]|uniref:hypothetical protein n=1 Tax=Vreelandella boliviensis TaxID=223527 RepID=UPI001B8BFF9E|nr:hypothetical protein [Halomonas boliviensis]MBS3670208.1 hypothetical protein [Halomonas boliviensis]